MTHFRELLRLLFLSLLLAGESRAQASLESRIDDFVRDEMARQRVPGVAVAVVHKGAVIKIQGYGLANIEHDVPVTPETVFESGSLGKQFTAVAVMLQVEDAKLSLSDPITKFFPDAPEAWRSITVYHLLTHTSGLPDYVGGIINPRKDYTEDQLARFAYDLKPEFPPGSRWSYSNTGYVLLGIIVHKVSGRFYGDVLTERVFTPLGMKTARVISEEDIVSHRAAGYRLVNGQVKNQEWVSPSQNTTADGSLYLSIRDLIAWDAGLRAHAVLRPESWRQLLEPARLNSGNRYPYGFGWFLDERGGQPLQWHGGSWQGFQTQLSRFIGEDLTVVVLANLQQASPVRIADEIAAIINPRLALPVPTPIADREPAVTERARHLLDQAQAGALKAEEFGLLRAGVFSRIARRYPEMLRQLGAPQRMQLVDRSEVGDDRVYLYELTFGDRIFYFRLGLAPGERISLFSLQEKQRGAP